MTKKTTIPQSRDCKAVKSAPEKVRHIAPEALGKLCPRLHSWLKEVTRWTNIDRCALVTELGYDKGWRVNLYTHEFAYSIVAIPCRRGKRRGYLGCTVSSRRERAGEDWTRGSDLRDGSFTGKTWNAIKDDIVAYELVPLEIAPLSPTPPATTKK